mmetsp:Transcript_74485/g.164657  ORF Transcript_74485/g.164657 Transcript_74485/m.164657 type:complete len:597 (+) Transcript_74485:90-1880(+)
MADKEAKVEEPKVEEAKTEDAEMKDAEKAEGEAAEEEKPKEPEKPKELEEDAVPVSGASLAAGSVGFLTEDTTLNVMPTVGGKLLMCLSEGGFQYLLAGARASTGVKAGRYMFEVKIMEVLSPTEDAAARQKMSIPKSHLRIGVATAGSSLFIGETADSVSFDSEGDFVHAKTRTTNVSAKFGSGDVVTLLLNVDEGENAGTVSLFKNGERASVPMALPEGLKGKPLFPALTFKNATVHYNFGKTPMAPLPFKCRMVQDASSKHATVAAKTAPTNGKYEVIFPVCLPDEGTFDWLDLFLEKNPQYTELSDRVILRWAEASGLWRPKGFGPGARSSNDKPEYGFGIPSVDDGSIRRAIMTVAPIQDRNYIVMEVKSNLLKEERQSMVTRWPASRFKTSAKVMVGEPPAVVKKHMQELMLKQKQGLADAKFKAEQAQAQKQKLAEKQAKEQAKALKKAQKEALKKQEELKRKFDEEQKKKEAAEKGDEAAATEEKSEEAKKAEEPEEEEEEEEKEEREEADQIIEKDHADEDKVSDQGMEEEDAKQDEATETGGEDEDEEEDKVEHAENAEEEKMEEGQQGEISTDYWRNWAPPSDTL